MDKKYGQRSKNDTILFKNVLIGFGSVLDKEEWVLLENSTNGFLNDVETPTTYLVDECGKVSNSYSMPTLTPSSEIRALNNVYGLMPAIEVLETAKILFDTLEKRGYEKEISKIREQFNLIISKINNCNGNYPVVIGELNIIFGALKQLYLYANGDLTNEKLKSACEIITPRSPDESVEISRLCIGSAKYKRPKSRNAEYGMLEFVGYISEERLTIYRDLRSNSFYYIDEKGSVVYPKSRVMEEYGIVPTVGELESFCHIHNAKAVILALEDQSGRNIFSKQEKEMFKIFIPRLKMEDTDESVLPYERPLRVIRNNFDFFLKCYMVDMNVFCLFEEEQDSLRHKMGNLVENIALLGLVSKDKIKD